VTLEPDSALTALAGVGPALAKKLERLGLYRVEDLLFLLPLRYEDRTQLVKLGALVAGERCLVTGEVLLAETAYRGRRNLLVRLGLGKEAPEGKWTPSAIAGSLALLAILFFAVLEASRLLGFEVMATLVSEFIVFAGHILTGLIIFALGLALANAVSGALAATETSQASFLGIAAKVAILVLAGAMALRQMGLANEIINIAFGMLLGAVAIAVAIAFGIGGRDIAAAELDRWVRSLKSKQE